MRTRGEKRGERRRSIMKEWKGRRGGPSLSFSTLPPFYYTLLLLLIVLPSTVPSSMGPPSPDPLPPRYTLDGARCHFKSGEESLEAGEASTPVGRKEREAFWRSRIKGERGIGLPLPPSPPLPSSPVSQIPLCGLDRGLGSIHDLKENRFSEWRPDQKMERTLDSL